MVGLLVGARATKKDVHGIGVFVFKKYIVKDHVTAPAAMLQDLCNGRVT
jgi:hypothetical protein